MKNIRWQLIIILITGLVIGLLLLSEQTGFRIVRSAPARGGVYTEALVGDLQRLNPVLDYYNPADRDVDRLIFSRLVRFDSNGLPQPELAQTWGISFDGLSYNFDLQPEAFWHDGQPVTSQDVVFTIEMMRDPASVLPDDLKNFWRNIDVIALGEKSLQMRLPEAFAPFMDYLNFGILPHHILGELTYTEMINSSFNIQPVGSGPYQFDGLIAEDGQIGGVILTANSNYYGETPFISQFVFRYYPDAVSAYNAYMEGNVQGLSSVTNEVLPNVLTNPDIAVYSTYEPQVAMLLMNLNNTKMRFFQDELVRRALLMGLDRRRMVDNALSGQGIIADMPILPNSWAYYEANPRVDFDPQGAGELLNQAEFTPAGNGASVREKDGVPLQFELVHPDDAVHTKVAEDIRSDWGRIGVSVELIPVPYDTLVLDYLQPLTYQAALVDLNFRRSPDPDPYPFWDQAQQSGGQNYSQWENRVVSEYLEQARVSTDLDERAKLYRNFQVIFSEELPALPLFYPIYNYAVDKGVGGIRMGAMYDFSDRFANISEWFLFAQGGNRPQFE